MLAMNNT